MICQNSSKELGDFINNQSGKVPIFGYPLLCYSPKQSLADNHKIVLKKDVLQYNPKLHSLWQLLSQSICASSKKGSQLLIKDLLDSHDDQYEKMEEVLKQFTSGKRKLTTQQIHDIL